MLIVIDEKTKPFRKMIHPIGHCADTPTYAHLNLSGKKSQQPDVGVGLHYFCRSVIFGTLPDE